jgi:2-phospho-L-lactate guanylyltransferase (CobY/MobA/RfbA family)
MHIVLIWFHGEEGFHSYKLHGYEDRSDLAMMMSSAIKACSTVEFGQVEAVLPDVPVYVNVQHVSQFAVLTEEQFETLITAMEQAEREHMSDGPTALPVWRR